jgi:uncharacterized protein with von Willebrand factor type A (vWA) domain
VSNFLTNLLVFGRLLRSLGVEVHLGRLLDVTEALQHVDLASREEVYHTCRALLIHRHEQLPVFDRAFDAFWRDRGDWGAKMLAQSGGDGGTRETLTSHAGGMMADPSRTSVDEPRETEGSGVLQTWSDLTTLTDKDFAEFTAEEIAVAHAALERLHWRPGQRRTRRWVPGSGARLDLRRALRRSVRTGGDLIALPTRRRRTRPRRIVLLCDVSGSMERYSRMLLHFAHVMSRRHRQLEAFLFSTGLTRITVELRARGIEDAMAGVSQAVPDWSGGTRIGDALKTLHQQWARRALRASAVVLLISDGWDRGDPDVLRTQIARLQRSCHRLIWLNPLIGTEAYEPLTRGLRAAMPFVDDFLPARTLTNLADLAAHLNALASPEHARS